MSRIGKVLVLCFVVSVLAPAAAAPDKVTLRDGSEIACRVVELDARRLLIEKEDGAQQSIPRLEVVHIELGQAAPPPIVARVKVSEGDDEVRLLLDGRELASPAELRAGWFDLAPLLRDGANVLEAKVTNNAGPWAYRWTVEAGAQKETFACGLAGKTGCRRDGGNGQERGTFEAGTIWIYVRRAAGEVVLQKQ